MLKNCFISFIISRNITENNVTKYHSVDNTITLIYDIHQL